MNKIQPIVFASPQPAAKATSSGSNGGMLVMVGMNAVLLLVILFVALRPSHPVPPGPEPGPGPAPKPVITEVVDAAILGHRAEAANYAKAHRRLGEMVTGGEIKDRSQYQAAGEKLMRAGRDAAWTEHLGELGNRYLPESFAGRELEIRRFTDSLATGFEE